MQSLINFLILFSALSHFFYTSKLIKTRNRFITLLPSHYSLDFAEAVLHSNSMLLFSTQNIVIPTDLLLCICHTETLCLSKFCLTNNSEHSLWSLSPYQYLPVCQPCVICKYWIAFMSFWSLRYWELSVYYSTVNARNTSLLWWFPLENGILSSLFLYIQIY